MPVDHRLQIGIGDQFGGDEFRADQFADVLGPYGVGAFLLVVNGLLYEAIAARARPAGRRAWVSLAIVLAAVLAYDAWAWNRPEPEDGTLDREALGAVVFRDEKARLRLNSIVHAPVIGEMMRRAKAAIEAGDPLVVLDIPLLFEGRTAGRGSGASMNFDETLCVWVSREIQVERTMARDACDVEEAERRIEAQLPIDEKREMADHVIDNSGTIEETRLQVADLVARLTGSQLSGKAAS